MIIECPDCSTEFSFADDHLEGGGSQMRCSDCEHLFRAEQSERGSITYSPASDPVMASTSSSGSSSTLTSSSSETSSPSSSSPNESSSSSTSSSTSSSASSTEPPDFDPTEETSSSSSPLAADDVRPHLGWNRSGAHFDAPEEATETGEVSIVPRTLLLGVLVLVCLGAAGMKWQRMSGQEVLRSDWKEVESLADDEQYERSVQKGIAYLKKYRDSSYAIPEVENKVSSLQEWNRERYQKRVEQEWKEVAEIDASTHPVEAQRAAHDFLAETAHPQYEKPKKFDAKDIISQTSSAYLEVDVRTPSGDPCDAQVVINDDFVGSNPWEGLVGPETDQRVEVDCDVDMTVERYFASLQPGSFRYVHGTQERRKLEKKRERERRRRQRAEERQELKNEAENLLDL